MIVTYLMRMSVLNLIIPFSLQNAHGFESRKSPMLVQSSSSQQCNCIKLKDCKIIYDSLKKYQKPFSSWLLSYLRENHCGFDDHDPLICCPNDDNDLASTVFSSTTETPWIWDIEEIPKKAPKAASDEQDEYETSNDHNLPNVFPAKHRFKDFDENDYHSNLIDFEDPRTLKNCPPSFFDYDSGNNFKKQRTTEPDKNLWGWKPYPQPPFSEFPTYNHRPYFHNRNPTVSSGNSGKPTFRRKSTTTIAPVVSSRSGKRRLLNSSRCGISVGIRIIGGVDAGPGQFPWMARLAYRNRSSGRISYRCAGSVINDHYVVTAAHCTTNLIESLELYAVRLGELNNKDLDCNTDPCNTPQDYEIERLIPHPKYDLPKYANDIALIRLSRSFSSTQVTPICLPFDEYAAADEDVNGKMAVVVGWGSSSTAAQRRTLTLQSVRLPIVNRTQCAMTYAEFSANSRTPIIVSSSQICAQGRENMDACQGDSGGPLMDEGEDGSSRYTLLGLVSFGPRTCGVSNFPGVYTRVSSYIDWMLQTIQP